MRMLRVSTLLVALGAMSPGYAQDYPTKPIHIVVPSPPGGGNDIVARYFARFLQDRSGQTVIVENKPGAQTLIGARAVASARPDGYTILFIPSSISAYPVFNKEPGIDVSKDLSFISMVIRAPQIFVVGAASPYGSVADVVAASKANPDKLNYVTYGQSIWLQTEMVNRAAGIKATHVRYSSAADAAKAIVNRDADYFLASLGTIRPWINSKQMKMLAVTSHARNLNLPEVLSLPEVGVKTADLQIWMGVFAPKGTPRPIIDYLNKKIVEFTQDPQSAQQMRDAGFEPHANTPEEFREFFVQEEGSYVQVGKDLGIKPE